MAWTQAERDALAAAVASGVRSVSYDGPPARTVVYHSLVEMRALLAEMDADLEDAAGTRKSRRLVSTRKGFDS